MTKTSNARHPLLRARQTGSSAEQVVRGNMCSMSIGWKACMLIGWVAMISISVASASSDNHHISLADPTITASCSDDTSEWGDRML